MLAAAAQQCDRAFLTGQAAKAGGAQVTGTPAFTAVAGGAQGLMAALGAGPAVVTLAADPSFQHYHAGLWTPAAACSTTGELARLAWGRCGQPPPPQRRRAPEPALAASHATHPPTHPPHPPSPRAGAGPAQSLLLVGYDTARAGWEYWLARNSLGASWGEAGLIRIAMAADAAGTCGMYLAAQQPGAVTAFGPTQPGAAAASKPATTTATTSPAVSPSPAKPATVTTSTAATPAVSPKPSPAAAPVPAPQPAAKPSTPAVARTAPASPKPSPTVAPATAPQPAIKPTPTPVPTTTVPAAAAKPATTAPTTSVPAAAAKPKAV